MPGKGRKKAHAGMKPKLCSIPGCERKVRALGLCNRHWIRRQRYGDPLVMRGVPNRRWTAEEDAAVLAVAEGPSGAAKHGVLTALARSLGRTRHAVKDRRLLLKRRMREAE